MGVATLEQVGLLLSCLVDGVVHEDLAADVGERGVEATGDEDAAVVEANGHSVALEDEVFGHKLLGPTILGKVVLQNHLRVVRVSKEVVLRDRLDLVVEEFERVLVRELHDVVL